MTHEHFCPCTDHDCKLNPHNPTNKQPTCDRCIRKNLKAGEVPTCFFMAVHADTSGATDTTFAGFANYVKAHSPKAD